MVSLTQLWLPILVSAEAVFVVSSVIHMLSPWHKGDFPRLANEDEAMDAMRPLALPPGDYYMPRPRNRSELTSPDFLAKMERGPVVLMTVMPNGPMTMGRSLGGWFVYLLVVSWLASHVASRSLPRGAPPEHVFHTVLVTAFAGYALALWQLVIWYRRSLSITLKSTVDGIIYALRTAQVFAWLWPR